MSSGTHDNILLFVSLVLRGYSETLKRFMERASEMIWSDLLLSKRIPSTRVGHKMSSDRAGWQPHSLACVSCSSEPQNLMMQWGQGWGGKEGQCYRQCVCLHPLLSERGKAFPASHLLSPALCLPETQSSHWHGFWADNLDFICSEQTG